MSDHSYGHGDSCYWCGANADTEDDRPCDERLRKKPPPTCGEEQQFELAFCWLPPKHAGDCRFTTCYGKPSELTALRDMAQAAREFRHALRSCVLDVAINHRDLYDAAAKQFDDAIEAWRATQPSSEVSPKVTP